MNKETEETTIKKRAVQITTILTGVTALAFLILIVQILSNATVTIPFASYSVVAMVGVLTIISAVGTYYCRNGRINLGMGLVGLGFIVIILAIPFVIKGRAVYVSPLVVALVVAIVPQLFSLRVANRTVSLYVLVGILTIALDAWLPIERTTPTAQPYAIFVFIAGLFLFIIYAAIQYSRFKLQTKLLIFLVFIPLTIVAVIGVYFISRISSQQQAQMEAQVESSLQDQADDLYSFLGGAEDDIQLLGSSVPLDGYLTLVSEGASSESLNVAKELVEEQFVSFAQTRLIYDQIRFIDASGQEIVRVDTDRDGNTTIINGEALQNKASRPYFTEAMAVADNEIYVSPLELNVERGEIERPFTPVLRYSTPVYLDGELQGVVVTNILADFYLETLKSDTQSYYLVDQDGYFIFHPDADKQWGRDLETGVVLDQELTGISLDLLKSTPEAQILQTQTELFTYTPIRLETDPAARWFLLNITPLALVLAPLNEALAPVQYVLAVALMLTPLIALYVSQSVAAPIVRLSEAAEQMGHGNFDIDIQVNSGDEVGVLANTLKVMNAELADLVGSLESRVSARTRDLSLAVEVSHEVSHVQTLETLLSNAVRLIRDRFDLYYTQIYLVEKNVLHLEAGSGEIGQLLLRQGHVLPIGPGSINGTAVSEKRSLIVADTATSPIFRPNPLLPDTRSEMSVPLITKDMVVGVLNLQSAQPNALTEENLFAFETLAGQLAGAIENARLFAEVTEARAAVEVQMNRLTRQGWDSYLDGIHQREFVGYTYEDGKITAIDKPAPNRQAQQTWGIQLLDETLGQISIDRDPEKPLSEAEIELIKNVGEQIGQQVENLRLLAEARRYQEEAEAMTQRLIQDGWQNYQTETAVPGFVYNQKGISALPAVADEVRRELLYPIPVGGSSIGEIALDGLIEADEHTQEIVTAVAARLGTHIENLRLTQQSEMARTNAEQRNEELALINRMMSSVTGSLDLVANMRIIASELAQALDVAHVGIALLTDDQKYLEVVSEYPDPTDDVIGTLLPIEGNLLTEQAMQTGQFVIAYDAQNNPLTASIHDLLRQRNVHMLAVVPMIVGNEFLGTVGFDQTDPNRKMSEQQMRLAETIVYQAATVVQNARLFTQTQTRAERERLLNKIVTQVAASLDLQHSLQIIVDELATAVNVDQVRVALIQKESNEMLIIAEHFDHRSSPAMGMKIPIEGNLLTQEVIETRKMVLVEDAQNNPRSAPVHDLFREQGIETVVLLPLVVNDEVIGTIGLDVLDKRPIHTDTLQLAETIVYQAANAIQNARLFEQSQAALAETETLYAYSSQLNTATNLDAVLDSAAAPGFQVGAADAVLLVYDQDTTEQAGYGQIVASSPKNIVPFGEKLSLREQPFSRLWPSGGKNILFVGDVAEEKRLSAKDRDAFLEMNIQALAIMFLSVGNLQLGQIIIRWHNKQTFTQADERLYGAIAQQASSVVYNRLLFNQTEEALSETAALYQASVDLNSADTYEQVLNTLRQHTILGQGSNDVTLNFFNRVWESDDMPETVNVLARWSTLPQDMPNHYKLTAFPEAEKVLQPDEWLICADVATDERMSEKTRAIFMKRFKARSLLYVPLVVGGEWIGFLNAVYSHPREFPEAQIRRLNVLARQAAVSVRSLQLLSQTHRRADREAMINSINQKIQSAPTVQSALQTAVTELSQALKLKKAVVELASEQLDNHNGNGNGHINNNGHNGSEKS